MNDNNITILVIDDELPLESFFNHVFGEYNILFSDDAAKAIMRLETQEVDLIILDLNMPHVDGIAFLSALRQRNTTQKVVVFSALESERTKDRAIELGITDYIEKPITDFGEFRTRIKKALGK